MSTPPEEPRYATGYGGARYPMPDDQPPASPGSSPSGSPPSSPTGSAGGQAPAEYSPYGPYSPPPAGLDSSGRERPARPGVMIAGLVLLLLAAMPFLLFGLVFLLGDDLVPPTILDNPQVRDAGITDVQVLVSAFRVLGGVFLVLAVLYVVFAVLAFLGRNWARILVAVMTAAFSGVLLLGLAAGAGADPLGVLVLLGPVVLAVGGLATWFVPQANRWYAAR